MGNELALELADVLAKIKEQELIVKDLKKLKSDLESQVLDDWAVEGMSSIKLTDKGTLYLHTREYAGVRAEALETSSAYLKAHGGEHLVKPSIHAGALSAFYKEKNEQGELPDGFADVFNCGSVMSIRLRK